MQGKACYGECCRELSIGKLGVAYGNPYYRNLGLFRGCLTEQELGTFQKKMKSGVSGAGGMQC